MFGNDCLPLELALARYYFHSVGGSRERDLEGMDLPDDRAAQLTASTFAGEILRDTPDWLWDGGTLRVEIINGAGVLLWTVVTLAVDAPRPGPLPIRPD